MVHEPKEKISVNNEKRDELRPPYHPHIKDRYSHAFTPPINATTNLGLQPIPKHQPNKGLHL